MKTSIARKTIIPVFLLFMVLIIVFFGLSYEYILSLIMDQKREQLAGIAENFRTQITDIDWRDEDYIPSLKEKGLTFCKAFGLDYVSMYSHDGECACYEFVVFNDSFVDPKMVEKWKMQAGEPIPQKISQSELLVLGGERDIDFLSYDNQYADELSVIIRSVNHLGEPALITLECSYEVIRDTSVKIFHTLATAVGIIGLFTFLIIHIALRQNVTKPAKKVAEAMNTFISGGGRSYGKLDEKRHDEFGIINRSFNHMADNIDTYIENIVSLKEIQERQKAELSISTSIQQGFLPASEAEFAGCGIRAMMRPAMDVGGDMYDYLQLNEENVLVLVADVSGKGLGAAMFMGATLMLLHQFAREGDMPDAILEKTNAVLVQKNPNLLFVTAFVGIYNNRTGEFTYSNAGHNLPYVLGKKTVKALEGAGGTVLGLFEGETYGRDTVNLDNGDALYLYTDGVTEATNGANEFYRTERLERTLIGYRPSYAVSLLEHVEKSLDAFTDGAPQADDITMLTLTAKTARTQTIPAEVCEFEKIKRMILSSEMPEAYKLRLCVAAEEIFVNICSYAFEGTACERTVEFTLTVSDHIEMRFSDGGIAYDPREQVTTADEYDIDEQIGGLGKLIAFTIADDVTYEYKDGKNILTIIKYEEAEE